MNSVREVLPVRDVWAQHYEHLVAAWRDRLYLRDPRTIRPHESGRLGMWVQRSRICHETARNEVIACTSFEKRDVVGSCYGSLAYMDFAKNWKVTKRHCVEDLEVTA